MDIQQQVAMKAHTAMAVAAGTTTMTWMEQANQIIDLIAGVVAVISGCLAAAWYIKRLYKDKS
jgi:hypothetical protein